MKDAAVECGELEGAFDEANDDNQQQIVAAVDRSKVELCRVIAFAEPQVGNDRENRKIIECPRQHFALRNGRRTAKQRPRDVKTEWAKSESRSNDPAADLTSDGVSDQGESLAPRDCPKRRARRDISDDALAGQPIDDCHEEKDFDHSDRRRGNLEPERDSCKRRTVERQAAAGN